MDTSSRWAIPLLSRVSGSDVIIIAFAVRIAFVVAVPLVVVSVLFWTGRIPLSLEQPGLGRHTLVDWGCPKCDAWGAAYVSRFWNERPRRRAVALLHRKVSPDCPASDDELIMLV